MTKKNNQIQTGELRATSVIPPLPSIGIDYARYDHYLKNADLTQQQKQEFLDTLWNIVVGFVDLGFGVHPIQQVAGEEHDPTQLLAQTALDMVEENTTSAENTNTSLSGLCTAKETKGVNTNDG